MRMFEKKQDLFTKQGKSIVFLTRPVGHTLGDPSAAAKLIRKMKEKFGDSVNISIILMIDKEEFTKAVCHLFKGLDIKLIPILKKDFQSFITSNEVAPIMNFADAIVFFPSFPQFKAEERLAILEKYEKKTLVVLEYDAYETTILEDLGDYSTRCAVLNTGLGGHNLGIFCTEETQTSNNRAALLEINDPSDFSCRDLLLERDAHIFFGYFNRFGFEDIKPLVNPVVFIDCCLKLAAPQDKPIDFILPLAHKVPNTAVTWTIEEIASHLQKTLNLEEYQIEFWIKNAEDEMVSSLTMGTGKKSIRFINGFHFTPHTMDKLEKASSEFTLSTGDQKLSEDLSNLKIPLYQTMVWKKKLRENLMNLASNLIPNSKFYEFLNIQKNVSSDQKPIQDFLIQHYKELLEEVIILRAHILKHKNLYHNLPDQIMTLLKDKDYIASCVNNAKNSDIFDLVRLYPNQIPFFLQILSEKQKKIPHILVEDFQKKFLLWKKQGLEEKLLESNWKEYLIWVFLEHHDLSMLDPKKFRNFCNEISMDKTKYINLLHYALHNPDILSIMLEILPKEKRLTAILELGGNFRGSPFSLAAHQNPKSFHLMLELFPANAKEHLLDTVLKLNSYGSNILKDLSYFSPDSLLKILENLPPNLLSKIIPKNSSIVGNYLHNFPVKSLEKIPDVLSLFSTDHLEIIQEQDEECQNLLHITARVPNTLQFLLNYFSSVESKVAAILEKDKRGNSVLSLAAKNPESLKIILQMVPKELIDNELATLQKEDRYGNIVLKPEVLKQILEELDISETPVTMHLPPSLS